MGTLFLNYPLFLRALGFHFVTTTSDCCATCSLTYPTDISHLELNSHTQSIFNKLAHFDVGAAYESPYVIPHTHTLQLTSFEIFFLLV